jgi:Tfp pilus assembly protein PilF
MQSAGDLQTPNRRLGSWKEIAAFFESDESTVRRWEKDRGLPIHRVPGGAGTKVFAYTAELTQWLERPRAGTEPTAFPGVREAIGPSGWPSRNRITLLAAGAASLVVVLAIVLVVRFLPAPAAHTPTAASSSTEVRAAGRNAEATAFYRAGLYEWQTRTPVGLTHAVDDFTQAIVHDPGFAEAYAGLANCYNLLREFSTMPPGEAYPRAKAAAERAIALNPSLGDAHADLAFVDFYWSRDVAGARREFQRALALEPRSAMAHHWYATFLMTIREFPLALREIEAAQALDSESTAILADKGLILFDNKKIDEALMLLQQLEQAEPAFPSTHVYLAFIDLDRGDNIGFLRERRADATIRHDADGEALIAAGEKALAQSGRAGMFKAMLEVQLRLFGEGKMPAYAVALTYADLDDANDAIAWLKRSLSRHEAENIAMAVDAPLARLRKEPSFRALLSQAGLPSS